MYTPSKEENFQLKIKNSPKPFIYWIFRLQKFFEIF